MLHVCLPANTPPHLQGSQDASLQDSLAVEQRVVQALEALNAVVAADPAKQRWLLSVGALPMLHALLLNMHGDKRLLRASARAGHYSSSVVGACCTESQSAMEDEASDIACIGKVMFLRCVEPKVACRAPS
jgi:hypothetical protein